MKMTRLPWAVAIAAPVIAIGIYVAIDSSEPSSSFSSAQSAGQQTEPETPTATGDLGSVDSLLAGLESRLAADPSDAKGWLLLAKSYAFLGRGDDAAEAYARAKALGQVELEFEATLHDSLDAKAAQPAIGARGASGTKGGNDGGNKPAIRGRLTLADSARSQLDAQDTIFIFAKPTDGSVMPVAVLRKSVADLPLDFELSDQHSMSAVAKLSNTAAVTITARVSKSGNAMQAEPGFEVVSEPVNVGDDVLVELHLGQTAASDGA